MEMEERKLKILQAIINDYINTGEPVGSRTIAKKYDLGISSATIRNEMADLEDMGYIEQLHTSSGRRPSDKGYRLYVDKLMEIPRISPEEEILIKTKIINEAIFEVDKILKQAMSLVSEMTKLTCIVKASSSNKSHIKAIQLIKVDVNSILCVILTDTGAIKNSIIRVTKNVSADDLMKLTALINERVKGLTIEQINLEVINNLKTDLSGHEDIFSSIITNLYAILKESDSSEVYMEGTTNIFNYPEFQDVEKVREFLSLVENNDIIRGLFNGSSGINISIGNENQIIEAKECSVISSVYGIQGRPFGAIGVIGPTRIPYSNVIKVITEVVEQINNNLNRLYDNDE
ncbi:heat-inducible transcriptional repressor HrcA [Clostridium hydrogenum]|uniref:heat-inducible transcriptional repressor HrcA n=1 Tax=Clostridium hydrogenum TaxID=2855764 RepID=UPI001EEEE647|nr:heat-inducible transcriptional repressor HrcA [Clostridium hydrogenum]